MFACPILKNNIDWRVLCCNVNAIELLKDNMDDILTADCIYWDILSGNYNAIDMLKENIDRIDWYYFSNNPNIFIDEPMPKII